MLCYLFAFYVGVQLVLAQDLVIPDFGKQKLFLFFCFLSFIECVCRACRIQYDDMALHCCLSNLLTLYGSNNIREGSLYLCGIVLLPQSYYGGP